MPIAYFWLQNELPFTERGLLGALLGLVIYLPILFGPGLVFVPLLAVPAAVVMYLAILLAPAWSHLLAFHMSLRKNYGTFVVRFEQMPSSTPPAIGQQFLALTRSRTEGVWWAWIWRSVLWGLPALVLGVELVIYLDRSGYIVIGPSAATPPGQIPRVVASLWAYFGGFLAWLISSPFVLRSILGKELGEARGKGRARFRVRLVATQKSTERPAG